VTALDRPVPVRLPWPDLARLGTIGLRVRPLRAALSAVGIALGVATVVAVLGLSASSSAALVAEIDQLGTNLLTVSPGNSLFGGTATLPPQAVPMIRHLPGVTATSASANLSVNVYRTNLVPAGETAGLSVVAVQPSLLAALSGHVAQGRFLTSTDVRYPFVVLGSQAAQYLGIGPLLPGERVYLGGQWFYVVGILDPLPLAPDLNSAAMVGFPIAELELGLSTGASTVYVRAIPGRVDVVDNLLAAAADPQSPENVEVSNPSSTLVARADVQGAFTGLFLALGAVALLVAGVGVANTMVISALERRSEIGLRRALGATRRHILAQFLVEAVELALIGAISGILLGAAFTAVFALLRGETVVVPLEAVGAGLLAAFVIGVVAGILPALRAAGMSPTEALRAV
jgi:putative ABC transport system permease protein